MLDLNIAAYASKNVVLTLVIVVIALIARTLAGMGIKILVSKLQDDDPDTVSSLEQRTKTLASLGKNTANILIFGSAVVMVMSQWGMNITPILTGAGIIGLAVGFGTQALVKDMVTGFFILLENQYNVGDTVKIAAKEGTIIAINLRITTLMDSEGNTIMIPNSAISTIEKFKKS